MSKHWGDGKEPVSNLKCEVCHKSARKMLGWSGYVGYVLCPYCRIRLENKDIKVIEILAWCFYNIKLKNYAYFQYKTREAAIDKCVIKLLDNYKIISCAFCPSQSINHFVYPGGNSIYYCKKCYNERKRNIKQSSATQGGGNRPGPYWVEGSSPSASDVKRMDMGGWHSR